MKSKEELAASYARFYTTGSIENEHGLQDAYLAGYNAAGNKWVDVKDRLPEAWVNVILLNVDRDITIGHLTNPHKYWCISDITSKVFDFNSIVAWQPLPTTEL